MLYGRLTYQLNIMTEDTIAFPPIVEPPIIGEAPIGGQILHFKSTDKPATTLKQTALASFVPIEQHVTTLAARYKDVAYDVTTTKGMADAKAARLALREEGRYRVQKLRDALKDEANDLKRTLTDEADRLIAIVQPVEDSIDNQIKVEEARKAAEREAKAAKDRERIAALDAKLAAMSGWIDRCREPGMTSERIANGIKLLNDAELTADDWQEYLDRAKERRDEVLDVMRQIHSDTLAAEMRAAELERQRVENERVAAELAAQRAEIERKAAQFDALLAKENPDLAKSLNDQRSETAVLQSAGQHSQENACSTQAGRQDDSAHGGADEVRGKHAEDCEDLAGVAPGPLHHNTHGPEPEEDDEGGIDLLRQALALCEHAALPFAGRFPSHPKPSPEWWAALREGIDRLQPRLRAATTKSEAAA